MRICYFGTYERDYPRNALLIAGLRRSGATVTECHEPVWELWRDKSGLRPLALVVLALRLLWGYARLALRYGRAPAHDVLIVGYLGQLDMPLAWLLAQLRGVPVLFNPMLSLYDTVCDDRALLVPDSLPGRALWLIDHVACRLADLTILDTAQHADYFARTFRLPRSRFDVVPIGADSDHFAPQPAPPPHEQCEVLFVGKLIPLHGCETIVRAAALLRNQPIHFTLVGAGQQQEQVRLLVAQLALANVTLVDWVEYAELPACYAQADICLGIFGSSEKASRVVPNKVFQALATGRPVITADTPAIRTSFAVGAELLVCPPNDAA
ncbi:MAG: glycosyltransferase, partial [Chloroflexales bacterium]|nr:glycosyltransferase [Chloroflexales bacterium]